MKINFILGYVFGIFQGVITFISPLALSAMIKSISEHQKLKMLRLEHQYPFLTNVYLSDGMSISKAVKDSMGKLINPDRKNLVTFRLDNDDALSKDFIKNLKKYAKHRNRHFITSL